MVGIQGWEETQKRVLDYAVEAAKKQGAPSAGWRIREIPDCASSPKAHDEPSVGEREFIEKIALAY